MLYGKDGKENEIKRRTRRIEAIFHLETNLLVSYHYHLIVLIPHLIMLSYDGEKIKCCLAYTFTKRVNAVSVTHSSIRTDMLACSSMMAR